MKTAKPFRFLWVMVLATSLLLASCGPAATTAAPTAIPTEVAPTEAAPTEAVEPTAAAEPVQLVYWSMWNETEPQGDVIKQAVTDFEAANPNVTVKIQWNGRGTRKHGADGVLTVASDRAEPTDTARKPELLRERLESRPVASGSRDEQLQLSQVLAGVGD